MGRPNAKMENSILKQTPSTQSASSKQSTQPKHPLSKRFRGFYPVVIDVETGGFNAQTDAILECAGVMIEMDERGFLIPGATIAAHIEPFAGANVDPASLTFTGIRLESALRMAVAESVALKELFHHIREGIKKYDCHRGVLVGHNAWFDREFLKAATRRSQIKRDPLHPFTSFDTATLAGVYLGHTVLAKALSLAGIDYDHSLAHSAIYDAECTAKLFCHIVNRCVKAG